MFTPKREAGARWTDEHQYLYSLLWSSFLDLDAYSASRFRRRFFPYSTEFVVRELLWDTVPEIRSLGIGHSPSPLANRNDRTPRLSPAFLELGLWTVIPRLFAASAYPDLSRQPRFGRASEDDFERIVGRLRAIVADQFRRKWDIEIAAFRFAPDARPLVPPGLGLNIEKAAVNVVAGRRYATATLSAEVFAPFAPQAPVAQVVDPATWWTFDYWRPPPRMYGSGDSGTIQMELALPGGNSATETKWRPLHMEYAKTSGAFGARVDFDCHESVPPSYSDPNCRKIEARRAHPENHQDDDESAGYAHPYALASTHVRRLRGYLQLEKVEGRPGWTRFVSQREAHFESPNHDRFRVETLMFWLACDLLSFAEKYGVAQDGHR